MAKQDSQERLVKALDHLDKTIHQRPVPYGYNYHPGKDLVHTFIKGIASGLGVLVSVAIVLPIILSLMKGVQWVPLVGDFVASVAQRMEDARNRR